MINATDTLMFETGHRSYAAWAMPRERGPSVAGLIARAIIGAIIRVRPLVLLNVALLVCAASGAGMFLLATYAIGTSA